MFGVTKRTLAVGLAAGGLVSSAGLAAAALTQDPDVPLVRGSDEGDHLPRDLERAEPVRRDPGGRRLDREGGPRRAPGATSSRPSTTSRTATRAALPREELGRGRPGDLAKGCEVPQPPQPIQLFVKCVDVDGPTFKAVFGYTNPNATGRSQSRAGPRTRSLPPLAIAASPRRSSRDGRVGVTLPGRRASPGPSATPGKTSSATTDCSTTPPPDKPPIGTEPVPISLTVKCIVDRGSTFDATFGYVNDNERRPWRFPLGKQQRHAPGGPRLGVSRRRSPSGP